MLYLIAPNQPQNVGITGRNSSIPLKPVYNKTSRVEIFLLQADSI